MMTSLIDVDSLLAIDVGSVNTRAFLFDVANGAYRFLAAGVAPTTVQGAFNNISDGVHMALEHLQEITGRTLIGNDGHLIVPTHADLEYRIVNHFQGWAEIFHGDGRTNIGSQFHPG